MTLSPSLLGVLPEEPTFLQTIIYQLNGLMIVFVVLGSLWLLMELGGAFFKRREARGQKAGTPPANAPASTAASTPVATSATSAATPAAVLAAVVAAASAHVAASARAIPPETAVVIAAATHLALAGASHRIVSMTPALARALAFPSGNEWALEGRRAIFAARNPC